MSQRSKGLKEVAPPQGIEIPQEDNKPILGLQKFKNRSSQFVATRDQELSDDASPDKKSKKGHQVTDDETKQ